METKGLSTRVHTILGFFWSVWKNKRNPTLAKVMTKQLFKINHPNFTFKIRANSGSNWGWWTTCVHARIQNFWLKQTTRQNFEGNRKDKKKIQNIQKFYNIIQKQKLIFAR